MKKVTFNNKTKVYPLYKSTKYSNLTRYFNTLLDKRLTHLFAAF